MHRQFVVLHQLDDPAFLFLAPSHHSSHGVAFPSKLFFQHPVLERQLGYRLLQLIDLTPHLHHFLAVGLMLGISDQALLPCFQKFFTLLVV
jgi:hypothetical protein